MPEQHTSMRLDKWLWCARFYKTRSLASAAIKTGKVKINNIAVKAARLISTGEKMTIKQKPYSYDIEIRQLPVTRKSAAEAVSLYTETDESLQKRQELHRQIKMNSTMTPHAKGRPDKRQRRKLIRFTRDSG